MSAKDEIITKATKENDRKKVEDFFRRSPLEKRHESVNSEMVWYQNADGRSPAREKLLPEYCYNIFDKFQRTYFGIMPKFGETIVGDLELSKKCKTVAEAKKVLKIDWLRMGRLFGIGLRGKRFVELESVDELRRDGFFELDPAKQKRAIELLVAKPWKDDGSGTADVINVGRALEFMLKRKTEADLKKTDELLAKFNQVAYEWGTEAMTNFSKGIAEGLAGFMDENRQLIGETNRANIYLFLLLVWPEIKEMQEAKPKKTVADLHTWMLPFMRHGIASLIDKETLRDVCAPPPSGIGLVLRPVKSRPADPSA